VTKIKIINAISGKNTTQQILEIIQIYQEGITIQELSKSLNRPVSMLQICLKNLIALKQISVSRSQHNLSLIYYPNKKNI
jgi:predicted transcriptional regulator